MDRALWLLAVTDAARLIADADIAASRGQLELARGLLTRATTKDASDAGAWLKLAALSRAAGDLRAALDAVYAALAIAPLDFTSLLMRASLLDRLDDPNAGEAYGHALAQRPGADVPPPLRDAIARAELRHESFMAAREVKLSEAMADAEQRADCDEAARIRRFRDNTLRKTRVFHSEPTHFHFPGLIEREFHPRASFPWLAELEQSASAIQAEFEAVAVAERAQLVPYIDYPPHEAVRQWKPLNQSFNWTAIHLWRNGEPIIPNTCHCPKTMAILSMIDSPDIVGCGPNAMFSLLTPKTSIPPHVGVNNTRLVCHLPLIVPEGCWFRVGAETRDWREGEAFVFDDTIEHEARNPTDELRVVLIFDVWHPGLSAIEREAVRRMLEGETASSAGL